MISLNDRVLCNFAKFYVYMKQSFFQKRDLGWIFTTAQSQLLVIRVVIFCLCTA